MSRGNILMDCGGNHTVQYTHKKWRRNHNIIFNVEHIELSADFIKWSGQNPLDRYGAEVEAKLHFLIEHRETPKADDIVLRPVLSFYDDNVGHAIYLPGREFLSKCMNWGIRLDAGMVFNHVVRGIEDGKSLNFETALWEMQIDYIDDAVDYIKKHFTLKFAVLERHGAGDISLTMFKDGVRYWSTTFELRPKHIDDVLKEAIEFRSKDPKPADTTEATQAVS